MAVVCLAGCKEEEPYADITIGVHEFDRYGGAIAVSVSSNGRWSVKLERGHLLLDAWKGEGDSSFTIEIGPNTTFDEWLYILTATVEGGDEPSVETFTQKASIGLEADTSKMISEEGGTFDLPVYTNDDITSVDTPDWLSYQSSRALTGHTYTFTAEPNQTGSVRTGTVKLKGKENTWNVVVSQDSYAPARISFNKKISVFSDKYFTTLFSVEPKYADLSKLEISTPEGCDAYIDNGFFKFYFSRQGFYPITFLSKGEIIQEEFAGYLPNGLFGKNAQSIFYLGQQARLLTVVQDNNFTYSSTNPGVVNIAKDGTMDMRSIGTSTIIVSLPGTGFSASQEITVQDAVLTSYMRSCLNWGYWWDVEIASILDGNNITKYAFCTCDLNQGIVFPQAPVEGEYKDGRNRMSYLSRINIYADNLSDLKERLEKVEVEFGGIVNGKQTRVTTRVLPEKPGWLK